MTSIRDELLKYPEYQDIDLNEFSDQTLLTHFFATRPTSATQFLASNADVGFGFGDIFNVAKKVVGGAVGIAKKVFKKKKIKIVPKEPVPARVVAPTTVSPLLTEKKSIPQPVLLAGVGLAVLLVAVLLLKK